MLNQKTLKMSPLNSKAIAMANNALEGMLRGVTKTADVIRSTMGARGQFVGVQTSGGGVYFTKDGANSASQIKLNDELEDIGCKMVIEAAINTADQAGDGTTSTTVLLQEIFKRGVAAVGSGENKIVLANELEKLGRDIVDYIEELSTDVNVDDIDILKQIATISANGDEDLGFIIADMVNKVGESGSISVMESGTFDTRTDIVVGTKIDKGYVSPYFMTNMNKRTCEFNDAYVIVTDYDFHKVDQLAPIFEATGTDDPIVIIGSNFEGEALDFLIYNKQQKGLKICCIRAPGHGESQLELLEDIAAVTGGQYMSVGKGLDEANLTRPDLGICKKIVISHDKTVLTGGNGDADGRVDILRGQLEEETNPALQASFKERIERLTGGVGVIYVGDQASSSLKEKMDRVEDAVFATQAAVEEGVVPGGGLIYLQLASTIKGSDTADKIVKQALEAPLVQICNNAGLKGEFLVEGIKEDLEFCIDVTSGNVVTPDEVGIIDPAKVVRCAIQNAFKAASTMLKTNAVLTIED